MKDAIKHHRYAKKTVHTAVAMYATGELTYRDISNVLKGRGINVSHKTVFEWVQKFGK